MTWNSAQFLHYFITDLHTYELNGQCYPRESHKASLKCFRQLFDTCLKRHLFVSFLFKLSSQIQIVHRTPKIPNQLMPILKG